VKKCKERGEPMTEKPEHKKEPSEVEKLVKEKVSLARKLGIWESFNPVEDYQNKEEFARIDEIDKRLAEIING
jgi:predicted AAA+ superfamily ATPase